MFLSVETSMNIDDSGYSTNTPNSVASLDSGPRSNQKLLQECCCKERTPVSSTPNTNLIHHPTCYRRKATRGRTIFKRPYSSLSSIEATLSNIESPFQSKELQCDPYFDDLLIAGIDSKENGKQNDIVQCDMEVDEEENDSVWKVSSSPIPPSVEKSSESCDSVINRTNRYLGYYETVDQCSESYSQDSGICSQDSSWSHHSQNVVINDVKTNRFRKLSRQNSLQETQTIQQDSQQYTLQYKSSFPHFYNRGFPCLIGREKVDFLSLLGERSNHTIIVKAILSYLEPVDLTAMAVVSKTWNRICAADCDSYRRVQCYLDEKQKNKENSIVLQVKKLDSTATSVQSRIHLRQIQNVASTSNQVVQNPPSPPPSPSKRRFLQFIKAAQNLENGKTLAPCPRCSLPSQIDGVSNMGQCTRGECLFLFCCICRCESHGTRPCPVTVSFPKSRKRLGSIGSKESKKNLRRL